MRKLASIRQISSISPIEGADFIELATVDGWQTIIKKGEFSEGDFCVFFEIDSFLPNELKYAFLKDLKYYNGRQGYRLRTMKLRGQLSQGLALPRHLYHGKLNQFSLGDDVTEVLNVIKYDNSTALQSNKPGLKAGNQLTKFPDFIPKTDQERIQNLPQYFTRYIDEDFEETLKLDGSSMTVYAIPTKRKWYHYILDLLTISYSTSHFGICSRNYELSQSDTSDFWIAAKLCNLKSKLPLNYAVQGELIGPRIQSNHEKVDQLQFYVFDVFDIEAQRYLTPAERESFCYDYDIPHVPVISKSIKVFQACSDLQSLLKRVEGQSMNEGTISEGRVYKSHTSGLSFKCINNEYLLKAES